jgi:hypothetical protein
MRADAVAVNCVGVTTGEPNGERILQAAPLLSPHVILIGAVEADDVSRLNGPVLPMGWKVAHRGRDEDKDGTLFAARRDRVEVERIAWFLSTPSRLPGLPPSGTDDRWGIRADCVIDGGTPFERERRVVVVHLVPPRSPDGYWQHQAGQIRRQAADLVIADFNAHKGQLRREFPTRKIRPVRGDVMGFTAGHDVPVGRFVRRRAIRGSDHWAGLLAV